MHAYLSLLFLFGIVNCNALSLYGVVYGSNLDIDTVSINLTSGSLDIVSEEVINGGFFYQHNSGFDQKTQTFYYVGSKAIYAVDVTKKNSLTTIPLPDIYGLSMMEWDPLHSQLLVSMSYENASYRCFTLWQFPIGSEPKPWVNLTEHGISYSLYQTYDYVNGILYNAIPVKGSKYSFIMQQLNLTSNPITSTQKEMPCGMDVMFMTYDTIKQALVGIAFNYSDNVTGFIAYAFEIQNDECIRNPVSLNISDLPCAAYDPISATFYISVVDGYNYSIYIFETATSQLTIVPTDNIVVDMSIAY